MTAGALDAGGVVVVADESSEPPSPHAAATNASTTVAPMADELRDARIAQSSREALKRR